MIKSLLKVGLLLVVGILGYNYFLGTPEEKAQAKEIIGKGVDVGKASVGLLKGEVNKFKSGKYDDALDKMGGVLEQAKSKVQEGGELLDKIDGWQTQKDKWTIKKEIVEKQIEDSDGKPSKELTKRIKELNEEAKRLEEEGRQMSEAAGE